MPPKKQPQSAWIREDPLTLALCWKMGPQYLVEEYPLIPDASEEDLWDQVDSTPFDTLSELSDWLRGEGYEPISPERARDLLDEYQIGIDGFYVSNGGPRMGSGRPKGSVKSGRTYGRIAFCLKPRYIGPLDGLRQDDEKISIAAKRLLIEALRGYWPSLDLEETLRERGHKVRWNDDSSLAVGGVTIPAAEIDQWMAAACEMDDMVGWVEERLNP